MMFRKEAHGSGLLVHTGEKQSIAHKKCILLVHNPVLLLMDLNNTLVEN
jgi:hypothetical protein